MWQNQTVSVVFPVYNEEGNIEKAIHEFLNTGVVDEVVVVDNNSEDKSGDYVRRTVARLVPETRQGYGFALRRGIAEAKGDLIILAEPDGTFIAEDIFKLLVYSKQFELVLGTRTTPEMIWDGANMGFWLRCGNWLTAKFLSVLFNTSSLSDCGCTLRLIKRSAAQRISPYLTVGASHFLPEMVILGRLMGLKLIEVPVNYKSRVGQSKITGSLTKAVRVALRMIVLICDYRYRSWLGWRPKA